MNYEIQNEIDNKLKFLPEDKIREVSDTIVEDSIKKVLDKRLSSREYYEVEKKLGTYYRTFTVTPSGQPPEGYRLQSGGCIYVNTKGGYDTSFSKSLAGKTVGISVATGYVKKDSATGVCVNLPNRYNFFIVRLHKKYEINEYKVDVYESGSYARTYYIYPKILLSYDFEPIKIK